MTNNSEGYVQVGVDVDDQSFAQLNTNVNSAANNMNKLTQANKAVADSADQVGGSLKRAFASVKSNIDDDINSIATLRAQLTGAADDAGKAQQKTSSGGGAGISGLKRTGSALTQLGLGDIGRPVQIAGDIQQVTKEFSKVGDVTKTLIPALAGVDAGLVGTVTVLAPVGIALAGIAAVGAIWNNQLEEGKKQQEEATTSVAVYYQTIQDGTSATIMVQKAKAQSDLDVANATLAALKKQRDDAFKSQQEIGTGLGDLGARIRTAAGALSTYDSAISDQEKKIPSLKGAVDGLTAAYGSQKVVVNDRIAAGKRQLQKMDQDAEDLLRHDVSRQQMSATGTVQGLAASAQAAQAELASIAKILDSGLISGDEQAKLVKRRDELNKNLDDIDFATPSARARAYADIVKKYDDAVKSAEDSAAETRINANQKLQDALVGAAQKAVEDASRALDQLEQKRASNLLSIQRDEEKQDRDAGDQLLGDQIKAQRQERDDLQQHLENLKQIRDRDASRERDDLLNRNYRDLFALAEQKNQDMGNENDRYSKQSEARQQALQDEEGDQARAIQVQRRERLISYQQANEDALKQYNLELTAAQAAKTKAIELAQQSEQRELRDINRHLYDKEVLLRQGAVRDLQLVTQTEQAKEQIFQNYLTQAQQILSQSTFAPFTGQTQPRAYAQGGAVMAGQAAIVNDGKHREGFNNSMFPPGLGLFIPAQSGYINPNAGGDRNVTLAPNYYITGVDAKQVADIADAKMRQLLKETVL